MVIKRSTWLTRAREEAEFLAQNQLLIPNIAFSTENYFKIAEKTGLIFFIFSEKTGKAVYVSSGYEKIWGKDPKYLYKYSNSWIFSIHPEDYHLASHTIATRLRSSYEFEEEFRIVGGGNVTPVKVSAFPVYCNAGCITYYFALFEDRSPYFRLAQDYQQNLDKFAYFFNQASASLAITDKFGKFLHVNHSFCRLTGYSQRELRKLSWHKLVKGDRQRDYFRIAMNLTAGQYAEESIKQITRKDGQRLEIGLKISLGQTENGEAQFNNQITDMRERRFIESSLISNQSHDAATNLPNRLTFVSELDRAIALQKSDSNSHFIVLVVRVDRIARIQGEVYELAIKEIIARIEAQISGRDTLAYLNNDNFGIIVRDTNVLKLAVEIAANIVKSLKQPLVIKNKQLFPVISVAVVDERYQRSSEEILSDGELTIESIKTEKNAPIKVFDKALRQAALYRIELASALPMALQNREFKVYYQPIICLRTGNLYGFEALVRWYHGDTIISPLQFIPICEETGMIIPLGLELMETACQQTKLWQDKYPQHQDLKISVNLSAKQFHDDSLLKSVQQILDQTGLSGKSLKLEVTESVFIDDLEKVVELLKSFTKLDIRMSIDDFGTGYSSLSYIQSLPAHTLKLDRAFVNNIEQDKDRAIAATIVTLAHMVGMDIIAEGIETEAQLKILMQLGCEYGQGYYFAKPLPEAEAATYLANYSSVEVCSHT